MNTEIKLETKTVGAVTKDTRHAGKFHVPSYQRGYRWGEAEVIRLLDDIYSTEGKRNYCLQPVVVKKNGDRYELIDGQQRLTTIYLIYRFMNKESGGVIDEPRFTLTYETRDKSEDFLKSIDKSRKEENIDFWFICAAYESIRKWFSKKKDMQSTLTNVNNYFDKFVKIIWYEVGESEDAISLFTRLNIGKIPLTNAELVKAMFLSRNNGSAMSCEKQGEISLQKEISLQWDNIEKELHNDSLWYFLTNKTNTDYQTRIDLVLDLISKKPVDNREKYYTFFKFDEMRKEQSLNDVWEKIYKTFLVLKGWYEDHDLYHKIGYLIASGKSLHEIFALSDGKRKSEFQKALDEEIKKSVSIDGDIEDLSYEKDPDRKKISAILLLFNVESVRNIDDRAQRFPFDKFKHEKGGKTTWSLEHIHAQQSEGMKTQKDWKQWLEFHIPSVESIGDYKELIAEMKNASATETELARTTFEAIQQKVVALLSDSDSAEYMHSIANLALLNTADNAALNNSTFDVKRNKIIEMDKKGQYIPFCTKMVFLKYYTPSNSNQLHFWGEPDRKAYIEAIKEKLACYTGLEKEETK